MTARKAPRQPDPQTDPGDESGSEEVEYTDVLTARERQEFDCLRGLEGIDDEIALLRVKLRRLLRRRRTDELRLINQTTRSIAILMKLRHSMTDNKSSGLKEAVKSVFTELAAPLGVTIGAEITRRIINHK